MLNISYLILILFLVNIMFFIRVLVIGCIFFFLLVWKEIIDCLVFVFVKFLYGYIWVYIKRGLMFS